MGKNTSKIIVGEVGKDEIYESTYYTDNNGDVYVSGVYDSPESPEELYMLETTTRVSGLAGIKIGSFSVEKNKTIYGIV